MEIISKINAELPVKIKFSVFHDGDIRYQPDIDIESVHLFGVELNKNQTESFIKDYGKDYLDELCLDTLAEMKENAQDCAA